MRTWTSAALLLLAACDGGKPAEKAAAPKADGPQAFFEVYRAALRTQDPDKILPLIATKNRAQFEEERKKNPDQVKKNLEFMAKFQEEGLKDCAAAAPAQVEGETHLVFSKPNVVVTARLVKEEGAWKVLKVGVKDTTPPAPAPK